MDLDSSHKREAGQTLFIPFGYVIKKKPLAKLKQQTERELTGFSFPLFFPLHLIVRTLWVITHRETAQTCFTKKVNGFVELGSTRNGKLQAELDPGTPMLSELCLSLVLSSSRMRSPHIVI